jgi:hypothetical protein
MAVDGAARLNLERALAVDGTTQAIDNAPQHRLPHRHLEWMTDRHHLTPRTDSLDFTKRHQEQALPSKPDHLCPDVLATRRANSAQLADERLLSYCLHDQPHNLGHLPERSYEIGLRNPGARGTPVDPSIAHES